MLISMLFAAKSYPNRLKPANCDERRDCSLVFEKRPGYFKGISGQLSWLIPMSRKMARGIKTWNIFQVRAQILFHFGQENLISSPYRILLVEDHVMFREMIAGSLRHFPGLEIVGELGDGAELLKSIETTRPNLIVMDIEMPGLSGLEAAAKIKQTYTEIKILLLTMHKSIEHLVRALDARVDGYLLKENVFQDLIAAIDTIRDGRMYLSPLVTKELLDDFSKRSLAKPKQSQSLSNRETEVLKCVAEGKSNKEIAEALGISDSTVRIHLGRIKKKLELKTNVDLTRYAIKNGFVSSP